MFLAPRVAIPMLSLMLASCASASGDDASDFRDRSVLTNEQLNERSYNNLYHAIETLRPRWLRPQGPGAAPSPGVVTVILNSARIGDVEALLSLQTHGIVYVRFYDAASAAARFGRGAGLGVIFVSTEQS